MKINVLKSPGLYVFAQGPAVFVLENADADAPDYLLATLTDGLGAAITTFKLQPIPGGSKEIYYLDLNETLAGTVDFEFSGLAELFADAPERLQLFGLQFNWVKDNSTILDDYVYTGAALRGAPDLLTILGADPADFVLSADQTAPKRFLSFKPLEYFTTPDAIEVLTLINKDVSNLYVRVAGKSSAPLALTAADNVVVMPNGYDFIAVSNVSALLSGTTTGTTTGHININVSPAFLKTLGLLTDDWESYSIVLQDAKGSIYTEIRTYYREESDCAGENLYIIFENALGGTESFDYRRAVFSDAVSDAAYMESAVGQITSDGVYSMLAAAEVVNKTLTRTAGTLTASVIAYTRQMNDETALFAGTVINSPNIWIYTDGYWQSAKPATTSNTYTPRRAASSDNSKAYQFTFASNYSVNHV